MDFCVIYFEYDKQITCVPTLKVKSRKLEPGLPCTVPFETETLGDDGREIINTEDYQGTIISIGQVKKKAVEMAVKGQKKLDGGEPLRNIIMEFKTAGRKRDAHGKMVQVLQELKDDESKPKTQKNQEEGKKKETQVKKKQKKQSKDTKISKSTQPESPQNSEESINRKKKHVPAEKMAEMLELLGPTQEADKPNTCIDNHTVAIPVGIIKTPDTDYKIFKNPSQSIPDREQENPPQLQTPIQLSTPLKKTKEILQSSTPRRSPRLNYLRCLNYEDISPVKFEESEVSSWDGTFVQSSQVLLNLDQQQNEQSTLAIQPLENQDLCNESGEFPLSEGVYQSRQQQTLCNLLGIAESEMQIAGNLLTRIGQTLLELSTNLRTESFPVMNHSTSSMSTSALYVTPPNDDIPNVPRAFSAPSEEIDLNQSIKKLCWNSQSSENLYCMEGKPWNAYRGSRKPPEIQRYPCG